MVDGLAAALSVLTFVSVLLAWRFVIEFIVSIASSIGAAFSVPDQIRASVFVVAIVLAVLIYARFSLAG